MIRFIKTNIVNLAAIALMALMLWDGNAIASNLATFLFTTLTCAQVLVAALFIAADSKVKARLIISAKMCALLKLALIIPLAGFGHFFLASLHALHWLFCCVIRDSNKQTNKGETHEQKQA